jgi:membrane-bound lytic murein transglycosylase D
VNLRLVSDIVGAPMDELIALNPSLLRSITPPDAPFDLHLPAGTATLFTERIEAIPEAKRNAWRYHRITGEDSLASVAREYRVTVEELAEVNHLRSSESGQNLHGVEALVVPLAPAAAPSARMLYTSRRGDTLVTIADRFGVSLNQLRRWNRISGTKVAPGRRLYVAEPAHARTAARRPRGEASDEGGSNAHKTMPAKGFGARSGPALAPRHGAAAGKIQHNRKSAGAAGVKKNRASGARKSQPQRPSTHVRSSTRKEK